MWTLCCLGGGTITVFFGRGGAQMWQPGWPVVAADGSVLSGQWAILFPGMGVGTACGRLNNSKNSRNMGINLLFLPAVSEVQVLC